MVPQPPQPSPSPRPGPQEPSPSNWNCPKTGHDAAEHEAARGRVMPTNAVPPGALWPDGTADADAWRRRRKPRRAAGAWTAAVCLLFAGGAALMAVAVAQRHAAESRPAAARRKAVPTTPAPAEGRPRSPQAEATVLLSADGPIGAHQQFWLEGPKRLVVDLLGVGQAQHAPIVAPHHPLIRRVRVGRHADRVRFVLEVAPEAHPEALARVDGSSLTVTLRAKEPADE